MTTTTEHMWLVHLNGVAYRIYRDTDKAAAEALRYAHLHDMAVSRVTVAEDINHNGHGQQ